MERADQLTFRNCLRWLTSIAIASVAVAFFPLFHRTPLIGVGLVLVIAGPYVNSLRTGQWESAQRVESFNWIEGWAVLVGAALAVLTSFATIVQFVILQFTEG